MKELNRKMKIIYYNDLISKPSSGHSFRNIKDAPYANSPIGNYKSKLNDNIVTWLIKARSNMLVNGNKITTHNINIQNNRGTIKCPYCGTIDNDTINHRLNSCLRNQTQKRKRHNMVQKVILEYLRNKYAQANTTIDHSITIDNMRVDEEYRSMRPDIVTWNDNEINIIEISCPYDMLDENQQDKMEFTYNTKFNKYKQLAQHYTHTSPPLQGFAFRGI